MLSLTREIPCIWLAICALTSAVSSGYVGHDLKLEGDDNSVIYSTDETRPEASVTEPDPAVYLNASVHAGTIDLQVDNLTAQINLDGQVLDLLTFNAGVDLSIASVQLLIQGVEAKVELEVKLQNLVSMINTTLNSIDLNPLLVSLGDDLTGLVNDTVGDLSSTTSVLNVRGLSYDVEHNILYSSNNYRASKHTNRELAQNGDLVDEYLNNDGQS